MTDCHNWSRGRIGRADETTDNVIDADMMRIRTIYGELCPRGRRILLYIAERLLFGRRTHGPWRPKTVRRIDKLEEIADGLIYTADEALDDMEG